MRRRYAGIIGAALLAAAPVAAQDRFGAAVGIAETGEVLVVKPGFGRGPAALHVFGRDAAGGWAAASPLWSEGSERGETFGESLALATGTALVASGDPDVRYGAYGFEQGAEGWTVGEVLELGGARAERGPVTVETVFAILQPPARAVASHGARALVSSDEPGGGTRVRVFERGSGGEWSETGGLEPEGLRSNSRFGAAMAIRGDVAAVGAPREGGRGSVVLFARATDGSWRQQAVLTSPDVPNGAAVGSSVAFVSDTEIAAGGPRARGSRGVVARFARGPDGWGPRASLTPPDDARGQAFGAALAATETDLWIGAPGAGDGAGRAYAFTRDGIEGEWRAVERFAPDTADARARFGASVAVAGRLAVVGSPGATGGIGAAAVYEREGDAWSGPVWLRAGGQLTALTGGEIRCEDESAAGFDCEAVDLQAYLPVSAIGGGPGETVSDNWGWTDPQTGREYALVGRTGGAAFLDVTDATDPRYLGYVPANPSGARDLKVYEDHLFFTGDGAGAHGLVVFDLARLRDVTAAPVTFEPDVRWNGIGSAHNLIIDTDAGFAFTVSTSGEGQTCGGGLVMIDVREPLSPSFAGCYTDTEGLLFPGRTHDAQCVVYRGPDEEYRGRQLCFASNETALRIVDVTDKQNPVPISAAAYPGVAYIHQGWLTEDQRYFFLDDELDELVGTTERTKTIIWDITDLDDPVVVGEHYGPNASTDHNLYIKGDRMYQANYQAGLRVVDIRDPENPREVGYFDTTPYGADPPGFNGAWTAFPFFESDTVLVTSMLEGVFLLKPRREELVP